MQVKKKDKLSKAERHTLIRNKLKSYPAIRVSELATDISVSTETIRRDLAELEEAGLIHRTYGGASRPLETEPGYNERDQLFSHQREAIAKQVATEIKDGEVVIIGSGSTTVYILQQDARILLLLPIRRLLPQSLLRIPPLKYIFYPGSLTRSKNVYTVLKL